MSHIDDEIRWQKESLPGRQAAEDREEIARREQLAAKRLGWCHKTDRVRPSVRSHLSGKPEGATWPELRREWEAAMGEVRARERYGCRGANKGRRSPV